MRSDSVSDIGIIPKTGNYVSCLTVPLPARSSPHPHRVYINQSQARLWHDRDLKRTSHDRALLDTTIDKDGHKRGRRTYL